MKKRIRTRYAPSPTGYLHIGGARTALFNYLFAKHHQGDFIFRLEDTDISRNVEGGERSQLDNLAWLGIIPDESPLKPQAKYGKYRQSEKLNRYQEVLQKLLAANHAYYAFDTKKELELQKAEQAANGIYSFRYDPEWLQISEGQKQERFNNGQYSIRLRLPKNKIYQWNDLVRGTISFNTDEIGDWVLVKSDGYPTYNFAVVVDDHDMEISHIFRGEEHVSNTPKQLILYDLLNWEVPEFGHLTIITNMEGQKLSKRDLSLKQFIEDYKNDGYPAKAIFNFLALLGWTDASAQEIFSKDQLINNFDYQRLSKSPSKFDITKMNWFGKHYFKLIDDQVLIAKLQFDAKANQAWKELFVSTYKPSAYNLKDLQTMLDLYKQSLPVLDADQAEVVKVFIEQLKVQEFSILGIQNAIDATKEITNLNGKNLFMPIRIATTNIEHGPELAKAIFLFGQDQIYHRLGIKNTNFKKKSYSL